ncbi:hypothetical protein [Mycobacterium sp. MFM001]|uniref:hypothetical protein n=1 Tax=Mycobacterium sp. MFM001 TaxID=2049453 RepID=UPI00115A6BFC|nr:hypothetical protein [Mycobacterium sp. MFM001]
MGLTLSIHPDRDDAATSLADYATRTGYEPITNQITDEHQSYDLIDPADGRCVAVAVIELRPADPTADMQFASAKRAMKTELALSPLDPLADRVERAAIRMAWDRITGADEHLSAAARAI